jgi:hypothetical protein
MFDLPADGPTVADLNVTDFASFTVRRGRPGGREKYLLNASAREVGGCADGADDGGAAVADALGAEVAAAHRGRGELGVIGATGGHSSSLSSISNELSR